MLFSTSVVARLPLATLSIGLLVHVERLTGSYAAAGLAAGALAIAQGVGGPLLGRLVDRHGQTLVLILPALVSGTALAVVAFLPARTPLLALLALAALIGFATPPVGACMRTLIPLLNPGTEPRAYAIDAAATELTWIAGPPLALTVGSLAGTGTALALAGAVLLAATLAFVLSPTSRSWRSKAVSRTRSSALASPQMRTLVLVMACVGVVFGATEVAVTASAPSAAGWLLGLWGLGSLAGGVVAARSGGGARDGRSFALLLTFLAAGHLSLAVAPPALIVLAGTVIAPILASAYAMVDKAAPTGTATEAFTWLATATATGTAAGAAAAGTLADFTTPTTGFLLAGTAALTAALIAATRIPSPHHAATHTTRRTNAAALIPTTRRAPAGETP
ncbi:MFS transporter [Paractinoplanes lichenicola]|uniref:MFS transporter n=1 Tax=Paractinoplanes lichenicola TaxID=2802976 RepID=A0ABS1VPX1_9ACTN|nr:MFS transporter [Actinoplanes lichenicola]MBL7255807.1 MFS transporter [Actinoplanes lichenicola]